jgi:chemosensory pili system protein ChpC
MPVSDKKKSVARKTTSSGRTNGTTNATAHQERSASRPDHSTAAAMGPVHCTLAPMQDEFLLLPTNVIAEVIDYIAPVSVHAAPQWFLGHIDWQNRQVPVFSYAALINGNQPDDITTKTRIMIVKSLSDSARLPYLGIVISDLPRLVSAEMEQVLHTGDERKSLGVFCHIELDDQPAVIPDLDRLSHLVTHAAYGILPITQIQN